jgi:hypothetical protein
VITVVGVAGDVRDGGARSDAAPEFYAPLGQVSASRGTTGWRARSCSWRARAGAGRGRPPRSAAPWPPSTRACRCTTCRPPRAAARVAGVERFSARLLAVLGGAGLLLAAVGIHGARGPRRRPPRARGGRAARAGRRAAGRRGPGRAQEMRPVLAGVAAGALGALLAGTPRAGCCSASARSTPVSLAGAALLLGTAAAAACYGRRGGPRAWTRRRAPRGVTGPCRRPDPHARAPAPDARPPHGAADPPRPGGPRAVAAETARL